MKQLCALILLFKLLILTAYAKEEVERYDIYLVTKSDSSSIIYNKYVRRFIYEAIISTNKFNIKIGQLPDLTNKKAPLFFVVYSNLQREKLTTNLALTLTRYPDGKSVNKINKKNISEGKLILTIRQSAYQLFYGEYYEEHHPRPHVIPLKMPNKPNSTSVPNSPSLSQPPIEAELSAEQSDQPPPTEELTRNSRKQKHKRRKERKNSSAINRNYKAPNITARKKITPPKINPRNWISSMQYRIGYSQLNISSDTEYLSTAIILRSLQAAVIADRKTYDDYTYYSLFLSLEKPMYKFEYDIPLLYDVGYSYHFRLLNETIFLSPFISYAKNYFINLIYFGQQINVLPVSTFWSGLAIDLHSRINLQLSYATAIMGEVDYKGVTAPLKAKKLELNLQTDLYKKWGVNLQLQAFSITTTLGQTSNEFRRIMLGVTYHL